MYHTVSLCEGRGDYLMQIARTIPGERFLAADPGYDLQKKIYRYCGYETPLDPLLRHGIDLTNGTISTCSYRMADSGMSARHIDMIVPHVLTPSLDTRYKGEYKNLFSLAKQILAPDGRILLVLPERGTEGRRSARDLGEMALSNDWTVHETEHQAGEPTSFWMRHYLRQGYALRRLEFRKNINP